MKLFLKLTDEVIKQNLRQLVLFTFLYRLVAGIFYIKTVNSILRFSLHMAGYSYLTTGNLRAFLLRPVTVFAVIFILFLGMAFMLIETGAMITAYHSSIYLRGINVVSVFLGGMGAAVNEFRKKKLAAVICCPWKLYFDELLFSCAYTDSHETGKFRIIRNLTYHRDQNGTGSGKCPSHCFFCTCHDGIFCLYAGTEKF